MAKVFVSYSRKDITFAKRLTTELQKCKMDFWIDWEGIPPTVDWWREIEKGIEEADIFLFLISPDSSGSKVCGQEIDAAVKNAKRIIPLVVRDIKGDEAPKQLSHLNWIFIRESDDFDAAVNKLITAIQTDYEWAATHRRLQVKALDWERNNKESGFLLRGLDLLDAEQDLAENTSKEPHPTDLQREYVFESRKGTDRQRRITTGISIAAAIALAVLAVFGFVQAKIATERANVALARQLAAQAQSIATNRNARQLTAILLAVQSMNIDPSAEAARALANNISFAGRSVGRVVHDDRVTSIALSPDGKHVVSGSRDGTALIWEANSEKEVARFDHADSVVAVAFSPDGKYAASGSVDGAIHVFNMLTNDEIILEHPGGVTSFAVSPNGKAIASGGEDQLVHVWDTLTGEEIKQLDFYATYLAFSSDGEHLMAGGSGVAVWETGSWQERYSLAVSADFFAFSANGKYVVVASGYGDSKTTVLDVATGNLISAAPQQAYRRSVAITRDGKYAASADWDGIVYVWEVATEQEIAKLVHDSTMETMTFSPDGKYLITGSDDFTARVWEISSGREVSRMTHDNYVYTVAFSPDGKHAASGSGEYGSGTGEDNSARVWETGTDRKISAMTQDAEVVSVAMSPDGKYAASGGSTVHVWDPITGAAVKELPFFATFVAFSSDGKYLMAGGSGIARWEIATWKEEFSPFNSGEFYAFSADGKSVASGSGDSVMVWDVTTGNEIANMSGVGGINTVAISPDGRYVASGSEDGTIHVWEVATEHEVARMEHADGVYSLALSQTGEYLVSGGYDNTSRIWQVSTGKEIQHLTQDDVVNAVAFDRDGKYVVSGSGDNTAIVWEAKTGREISGMTHDNYIFAVAFSPDGKHIISGGQDNTVFIWEWQMEDLVKNACENLPRNLTRAEWNRYIGEAREYEATCPNLQPEPEGTPTPTP